MTYFKNSLLKKIIFIAIILSTGFLAITYSFAPRDTSWISEVENRIKQENWEPNREYIPLMLDSFFLHEDEKEEFFYLYSHHEFVSYIENLERTVNRKIINSVSKEYLDEVLASNKVIQHNIRHDREQFLVGKYEDAYFVLEDNLGRDLQGAIIFEHFSPNSSGHSYDVWEIADWFF